MLLHIMILPPAYYQYNIYTLRIFVDSIQAYCTDYKFIEKKTVVRNAPTSKHDFSQASATLF